MRPLPQNKPRTRVAAWSCFAAAVGLCRAATSDGVGVHLGGHGGRQRLRGQIEPADPSDDCWVASGRTYYYLYERGESKEYARVSANGRCYYNRVACAPDDPRLLALIVQVAPVEVRPAAPAPTRHSPPTRPQAIVRWIGRLVLPPQALAAAVATEVDPHFARRRWWLRDTTQQQPHCKARPPSDAYTGFFAVLVSREAPSCALTTAAWGTPRARRGSLVAMP